MKLPALPKPSHSRGGGYYYMRIIQGVVGGVVNFDVYSGDPGDIWIKDKDRAIKIAHLVATERGERIQVLYCDLFNEYSHVKVVNPRRTERIR